MAQSADGSEKRSPLFWFEVVATVLLAFATVATAWSGYQASRWNGEQAKATAGANAARFAASRAADLANAQKQVDVALFVQWVDAFAKEETELEQFYVSRFRDEFTPAFDAWVATQPRLNPEAPKSPFAMEEYVVAAEVEAAEQDDIAAAKSSQARENIQRSTNYVLGVVLFAATLFFAGMSTRITMRGARVAILAMGCVLFVGTLVWVATMPVSISV